MGSKEYELKIRESGNLYWLLDTKLRCTSNLALVHLINIFVENKYSLEKAV